MFELTLFIVTDKLPIYGDTDSCMSIDVILPRPVLRFGLRLLIRSDELRFGLRTYRYPIGTYIFTAAESDAKMTS